MIGLAECAPCKAMRLQEEAEEEFRKRFGFVKLNGLSWRPHMGQISQIMTSLFPEKTYWDRVGERAIMFAGGAAVGLPLGLLFILVAPSLSISRNLAMTGALISSALGSAAILLPFKDSKIVDGIAKFSGLFTGNYIADMAFPKKRTA